MKAQRVIASGAIALVVLAGCGVGADKKQASDAVEPSATPRATAATTVPDATAATSQPDATTKPAAPSSNTATTATDPKDTTKAVAYSSEPTAHQPAKGAADYVLTDVRVGQHDGFDRVVVELTGSAATQLSWRAEYTDNPHTLGRGNRVDPGGKNVLAIHLQGLPMALDPHPAEHGMVPSSAQGNVAGVYVDPSFEMDAQVFIGLDRRRAFHVSTLDSPTRLVVDIQQ